MLVSLVNYSVTLRFVAGFFFLKEFLAGYMVYTRFSRLYL